MILRADVGGAIDAISD